jgi:hypothetical protein
MSMAWRGGVLVLAACAMPMVIEAQSPTRCRLIEQPTTRLSFDSLPGVGQVIFIGGGVSLNCPGRGITLKGDSAEQYSDHDYVIGHVIFDDPRFHVTSDFLNYYPNEEKVVAVGNVNARLPSGSTLVGPIAEYKRAVPRVRTRAELRAQSRPTITIVEKDSTGKATTPTTVVAERVFMDGDSLIYANGQVVITRPEITATADSVFLDQTREIVQLRRRPELKGKKEKPYTLKGEAIDLYSRNRKLNRVISRANATAVSDSMTLQSDTIDLRVVNDLLDHAYAWGGPASRARALSPSQNLQADSIDVWMPGQKVREIRAVRRAFAEGKPDSVRFRVEQPDTTDWMKGDTITARFDSTATTDTAKSPRLRKLTASGRATSLYHLAPSDSAERRPAINYVVARLINVDFDKQRVATVTTVDSVHGVYLEPRADSIPRRNAQPATPGQAAPRPGSMIPLPTRPPTRPPPATKQP